MALTAFFLGGPVQAIGGETTVREVVIVPVGLKDPESLQFLSRGIERVLSFKCRIGTGIPLPERARHEERGQYLSTAILGELRRAGADKGVVALGVADRDLYVPDLNFVFGEAEMGGNVCAISLYRLRQETYGLKEDGELFERRALTEAIHEIGHTLGLRHCTDPHCVMYFSNNLADTDRKGFTPCGRCGELMRR